MYETRNKPKQRSQKKRNVKLVNRVLPDQLTAVYQALDVEADVVETVADTSLDFRDGCSDVPETWAERDDLMEALMETLIH